MKEIKNIVLIKNVIIYNSHHKKNYFSKEGLLIIEYEDNTKNILDIESNSDITNCNYLIPKVLKGKSKIEYIFKEDFLNI